MVMRVIGETIYTGRGLKYDKRWLEGMVVEYRGMSVHWSCGHVTDHGSIESPTRCPICSCDRLKNALIHEVVSGGSDGVEVNAG